ncbi:MAG TPA: glycosyltransferase [Gammaproteobacteria bacterium]|nr:glycosyltransferase [Gammaproteobacteria bacterium]
MRIVLFYHSLVSDWNHGNAHFLRGIASELIERGHELRIYEPVAGWSLTNLCSEQGAQAIDAFRQRYPQLASRFYRPGRINLDRALAGADLVLVHEWNDPELIAAIGAHHTHHHYVLLFHDTHHRSVSARPSLARCDLGGYDGVLAFGDAIRERYLAAGWARRAWTWHEAADVRVFQPQLMPTREGDLVWIGNWGDNERDRELGEYLLRPVAALRLQAAVYGVRYPYAARRKLAAAGIDYRGWLANFNAPGVYARHRVTVHVPRRPYVKMLPGIPTIRVFEALACGIPLVCAPWNDTEHLFTPGDDYLVARNGNEMQRHLRAVLNDDALAAALAANGRRTVLARHTCAHRVDQLLALHASLSAPRAEVRLA